MHGRAPRVRTARVESRIILVIFKGSCNALVGGKGAGLIELIMNVLGYLRKPGGTTSNCVIDSCDVTLWKQRFDKLARSTFAGLEDDMQNETNDLKLGRGDDYALIDQPRVSWHGRKDH